MIASSLSTTAVGLLATFLVKKDLCPDKVKTMPEVDHSRPLILR